MADLSHDIQFALSEFDRSQLPEAQRALEGDAFREAVFFPNGPRRQRTGSVGGNCDTPATVSALM